MAGARLRVESAARSLASTFPFAAERVVPYGSRREQLALRARRVAEVYSSTSGDRSSRGRPSTHGPRVLVIDKYILTPDRDSGSVRMLALLEILTELGAAVAFAPASRVAFEPYASDIASLGVRVVAGRRGLDEYLGDGGPLAGAFLSRAPVARAYLPVLRARHPETRVIFDTVDLQWVREERRAALEHSARRARMARAVRNHEMELVGAADASIAITEEEASKIRAALPGAQIHVIPNIHETQGEADPAIDGRRSVLFVGNFRHDPNVDAAAWLVREIAPLLRRSIPDLEVRIAGGSAPREVLALASSDVSVLGWVPDLAPLYARARAVVAPLRYGAGMKGKIGEAMAHGVPVVTTNVGAEGFDDARGRALFVAEEPESFAAATVRLFADDAQWHAASAAAQTFIAERFSRAAVRGSVSRLLTESGILLPRS